MKRQVAVIVVLSLLSFACAKDSPSHRVWVPVEKAEASPSSARYELLPVDIPGRGPEVHVERHPQSLDDAFAQLQLRCAAVELELDKKIRYDTHTRWGLIVTALASSAFAAGSIAAAEVVDDGNGRPSAAVRGLRISSAGFAALAGVFTGTSAAVGFEGRLEKRRQQRKTIVQARHDAVAGWNTATPADIRLARAALEGVACEAERSCVSLDEECGAGSCVHRLALAWHRARLLEDMGRVCHMPEVEESPIDLDNLREQAFQDVVNAQSVEDVASDGEPEEEGGDDGDGDGDAGGEGASELEPEGEGTAREESEPESPEEP